MPSEKDLDETISQLKALKMMKEFKINQDVMK